jgi:EAL domain-containing protein (putative c-di-GMP-specific phosphodiesterase class I)
MILENVYKLSNRLKTYKMLLSLSFIVFVTITIWQSYYAVNVHTNYQDELMTKVIDRVDSEYQKLIEIRKLKINKFQLKNKTELTKLFNEGESATKENYMKMLNKFKAEFPELRLFSIINKKEEGIFKKITGDFLPDCKDEIHDVVSNNKQENLFLHRSSKSMHYDLMVPLKDNSENHLFVAFNVKEIQDLLVNNILPHQELFLLRNDNTGLVELSSVSKVNDNINKVIMKKDAVKSFHNTHKIKNTRWNIAVKLSDKYKKEIILESVMRGSMLIVIFFILLCMIYVVVSKTYVKLSIAKDIIKSNNITDPLTGFYNKYEFSSQAFELKNKQEKTDILTLKLVGTESLNQEKDSEYLDYYLKTISNYLIEEFSENLIYGRIKDVLCICLSNYSNEKIENVKNEINKILLSKKCLENIEIKYISIQLCENFNSSVEVINVIKDLKHSSYKNEITMLTCESEEIKHVFEEQKMLKLLRKSIKEESIVLYKQKIQSVKDVNMKHFEVLVRLLDENKKIVLPYKFIPIAEQTGDIVNLDKLIIKKSIESLNKEDKKVSCSINLSGKTLTDKNLKTFITSVMNNNNISPERVTFEVTETYAVEHIEVAKEFIEWARDLGFLFALDDFGQGVSSFSYLQTLPINKLKIDGSFIKDIETNETNRLFVETMIKLSHQMGMTCVAEFVENKEIIKILEELDVDYLQGYCIEKPNEWKN